MLPKIYGIIFSNLFQFTHNIPAQFKTWACLVEQAADILAGIEERNRNIFFKSSRSHCLKKKNTNY